MSEYPQSDQAERIVRLMWMQVMEKPAIAAYLETHPHLAHALPVVNAAQAAELGAREVMADEEDERVARIFLGQMLALEKVPPQYAQPKK